MTDMPAKSPKIPVLKPSIGATGFLGNFGGNSVVDTSFLYRFHCLIHSLYAVTKHLELSNSLQKLFGITEKRTKVKLFQDLSSPK